MPSFREVAAEWQKQMKRNSAVSINSNLVFLSLGDIDIKNLTSAEIQNCLSDLYDNEKLRGIIYASYEKLITDICKFALEKGYILEVPTIERRREPDPNLYNQPHRASMELLLSHEDYTPIGTILRLAWYCGLRRNEITFLQWEQVDLNIMQIVLPDRKVPLIYEMVLYLSRLFEQNSAYSEYVLVSQRKTAPMSEQSVSAIARKALNNYGQNNVRLNDLRSDFIIRTLRKRRWEYVSYISGVDLPSLQQHYLPYVGSGTTLRDDDKPQIVLSTREKLLGFIETEETSMVGLALRFVWQMGIPVSVLPLLTWDIIDLDESQITFVERTIYIPADFMRILKEVKNAQNEYKNVILNENRRKPTDCVFIQKAVQQSLIRSGIQGITLPALQYEYWKQHYSELKALWSSGVLDSSEVRNSEIYSVPKYFPKDFFSPPEDELIQYLGNNGSADYKTIKAALMLTDKETNLLLKELKQKGQIAKVGIRYYLPDGIVQQENQKEVVLEYVEKHQPVTSSELTKLLRLEGRRQIYWVINPMLKSGELIRLKVDNYCLLGYKNKTQKAKM